MLDSVHEHAFVIKLPQTLFVASEPTYRIPRALVYPARNPEARHDGRTMSKQVQITFDASDPHGLAAWWADLLGYAVEDGHDLVSGLLESRIITDADVVELNGRLFFKDAVAASDPDDNGRGSTSNACQSPRWSRTGSTSTYPSTPRSSTMRCSA